MLSLRGCICVTFTRYPELSRCRAFGLGSTYVEEAFPCRFACEIQPGNDGYDYSSLVYQHVPKFSNVLTVYMKGELSRDGETASLLKRGHLKMPCLGISLYMS